MQNIKQIFVLSFIFVIVLLALPANAQFAIKRDINIPDISGYTTLKCDFHMHTVFSDGSVWPTVRIDEAWREGLDAIAITDHIEVQPHKTDIPTNHNRPYELAIAHANEMGIILIRGAEITRDMPPGHYNALFLNDINPLDTKEWKDSIKAAVDQGAFIFWNHPGWPAGKSIWYPEHEELYKKGWVKGVEVINEYEYYPEALGWCLEKNMTIIGNSDVHEPINMAFDLQNDGHRPLTLVFAKEKNSEGIKDALMSQRTAVYWKNMIIGDKKYLNEIFNGSIKIVNSNITVNNNGYCNIQILNNSDINYELIPDGDINKIDTANNIIIPANTLSIVTTRIKTDGLSGSKEVNLPFRVKNLIISPDQYLPVSIALSINFAK